ncbi:MAG: pseudouridine synthase [Acidobacteriota bacterium]
MTRRGPGEVSLERALSKMGYASRTEARRLIKDGRVALDGVVVRDPGAPVVPERVKVKIDGAAQQRTQRTQTLMLHKPPGTVVTRRDPEGRPTVFTLLGEQRLKLEAVGRLDMMTTGLLLFTNDTRFSDWLTDPASGVIRRYSVVVRGNLDQRAAQKLCDGVEDRGETLCAESVEVRKRSARESHAVVELVEGKNREIRRMFAALGFETTKLKRLAFGGLALGNLRAGEWREVTGEELAAAFPGARSRTAGPTRRPRSNG